MSDASNICLADFELLLSGEIPVDGSAEMSANLVALLDKYQRIQTKVLAAPDWRIATTVGKFLKPALQANVAKRSRGNSR